MNKVHTLVVISALLVVGCARNTRVEVPVAPPPQEVERSVEVDEGSPSDYAARAAHGAIEAGQATYEAGEEAYDWLRDKKKRAKRWLHEATAEEKKSNE